jgi:hypothetical protein
MGYFFPATERRVWCPFTISPAAEPLPGWNGRRRGAERCATSRLSRLKGTKPRPANSALEPTAHSDESRNALRLSANVRRTNDEYKTRTADRPARCRDRASGQRSKREL